MTDEVFDRGLPYDAPIGPKVRRLAVGMTLIAAGSFVATLALFELAEKRLVAHFWRHQKGSRKPNR